MMAIDDGSTVPGAPHPSGVHPTLTRFAMSSALDSVRIESMVPVAPPTMNGLLMPHEQWVEALQAPTRCGTKIPASGPVSHTSANVGLDSPREVRNSFFFVSKEQPLLEKATHRSATHQNSPYDLESAEHACHAHYLEGAERSFILRALCKWQRRATAASGVQGIIILKHRGVPFWRKRAPEQQAAQHSLFPSGLAAKIMNIVIGHRSP